MGKKNVGTGGNPSVPDKAKNKPVMPENQAVKGVKSVNPIKDSPDQMDSMSVSGGGTSGSGGSYGGPINAIRNTLSAAGAGITNFVKDGFRSFKDSGFGTKKLLSVSSAGLDKVSGFLHIPKAAAGVLTASLLFGTVGTGITMYQQSSFTNHLVRQEDLDDEDDCLEDVAAVKSSPSMGDTGGMAEEYAIKAWGVGKAIGMSDAQCAAMLGNMNEESHLDPTTIETIYDEPFNIKGARKQAAIADLCAFTTTAMRAAYLKSGYMVRDWTTSSGCHMSGGGSGTRINSEAYEGTDGHFFPGIGLFGFTGPEGNALVDYANAGNKNWWDFDLQMAFIIDDTGGYSRANLVRQWIIDGEDDVAAATTWWNLNFEGNRSNFKIAERTQYAQTWYAKLKGTSGDTEFAQSVIGLADSIAGGSAAGSKAASETDKCASAKKSFDNGDLARAAVAYAYETVDEGRGNNGTALYRFVHDEVAPGDKWYQSCDRGVATAVRWSDYDDDFPMGATDQQDAFFQMNSTQWEMVGEFGNDIMYEDLQPGDIMVTTAARRGRTHGHIVIYVSNEVVKEKYPGSDASFVSASFQERSPGCETWVSGKFYGQGYYVYRCSQPDNSGVFKNIAEGKNLSDR